MSRVAAFELFRAYFLCLLAEACREPGRLNDGLGAIARSPSVPWISNRNPVPLAVPPLTCTDATAPLWRTSLRSTWSGEVIWMVSPVSTILTRWR